MGEIADAIVDGYLDSETGEIIDGDAPGYPRTASRRDQPMSFQTFREHMQRHGIGAVKHTHFHWQAIGQRRVNYWPSKQKMHVDGRPGKARRVRDLDEVVKAAGPPVGFVRQKHADNVAAAQIPFDPGPTSRSPEPPVEKIMADILDRIRDCNLKVADVKGRLAELREQKPEPVPPLVHRIVDHTIVCSAALAGSLAIFLLANWIVVALFRWVPWAFLH